MELFPSNDGKSVVLVSGNAQIELRRDQVERICKVVTDRSTFSLSTLGNRLGIPRQKLMFLARCLIRIGCISPKSNRTRIFVKEKCPTGCPIREVLDVLQRS